MIDNAYAELGLAPGATEAEIKAAWRRLVARWHPDRNPSALALQRMQRINEALRQLRSRLQTDDEAASAAEDRPAPAAAPPRSVRRRLRLSLEEAALGCIRSVRGRLAAPACADCGGQGQRLRAAGCPACGGSGRVRRSAWFGWASLAEDCADCGGDGAERTACPGCGGHGRRPAERYAVEVRIPPGVRRGDRLQARPPAGQGPAIELELQIEIAAHPWLEAADDGSVRCEVPVDGFAWIAGRTIEVPTLDGPVPLALQPGRCVYRLPARGLPMRRRGPRADQVVVVVPDFPAPPSDDQRVLLEQLIASTAAARARRPDDPVAAWRSRLERWQRERRPAAR